MVTNNRNENAEFVWFSVIGTDDVGSNLSLFQYLPTGTLPVVQRWLSTRFKRIYFYSIMQYRLVVFLYNIYYTKRVKNRF